MADSDWLRWGEVPDAGEDGCQVLGFLAVKGFVEGEGQEGKEDEILDGIYCAIVSLQRKEALNFNDMVTNTDREDA